MSLVEQVIDLVERRGAATVDDLLPELSGYTRTQVISALNWARQTGRLSCDGLGPRRGRKGGGSNPGTYRAVPRPRINSVFALAQMTSP
jgi:hypothetical protein